METATESSGNEDVKGSFGGRTDPRIARVAALDDLTTTELPSIAGGVSWILGLLSIPLLLLPPAAVVTGLLAIVLGHVAKSRIRKRPEVGGESAATMGLLMGYLCFFAAVALLPLARMQTVAVGGFMDSYRGTTAAAAGTAFEAAEQTFLDSSDIAIGHDDSSTKIADSIASNMNQERAAAFAGRSPQDIRVLCQKGDGGMCVVILVPDFAEFDEIARTAMLNLAWKSSQKAAHGTLTPGDSFAVAVRDRRRYYSMEFGRATISPNRIAQPDSAFIDVSMLERFFAAKKVEPDTEPASDDLE